VLQGLPEVTEKVVCCRDCQKDLKKSCAAGTARRNWNSGVLQGLPEGTEKVVCCRDCQKELKEWRVAAVANGNDRLVYWTDRLSKLVQWCVQGLSTGCDTI